MACLNPRPIPARRLARRHSASPCLLIHSLGALLPHFSMETLPKEIYLEIFSHLSQRDLRPVSETSRIFAALTKPRRFEIVHFDGHPQGFQCWSDYGDGSEDDDVPEDDDDSDDHDRSDYESISADSKDIDDGQDIEDDHEPGNDQDINGDINPAAGSVDSRPTGRQTTVELSHLDAAVHDLIALDIPRFVRTLKFSPKIYVAGKGYVRNAQCSSTALTCPYRLLG
jgi:hypothetical protein